METKTPDITSIKTSIKKIFFVIPWYGQEAGGAEYHAHLFCRTLAGFGLDVEVLTTCSRDVGSNWYKDYYPAGETRIDNLVVRRFPVRKGGGRRFHDINARLINGLLVSAKQAEEFFQNSINSDELLDFIRHTSSESVFIFMPYQYGTTVLGTRIFPERSFLIPCLHDDPIAYLLPVRETFRRVRGILFSTPPEAELARALFGLPEEETTETFGVGIHEDFVANPERFRTKYQIPFPYILFTGRKEPGKNVYFLIEMFTQYIKEEQNDLHLILIGQGKVRNISRDTNRRIIDLGYIPEQDKRNACAGAVALVQPSNRESFSMVVMESWLAGTPVLVNGHCPVTRWLVQKANGGLYFENYYEFKEGINLFLRDETLRELLGSQGKEFITQNYRWDSIVLRAVKFITTRLKSS